jgi:hypothetical protein
MTYFYENLEEANWERNNEGKKGGKGGFCCLPNLTPYFFERMALF